jgi:hypothetical protein
MPRFSGRQILLDKLHVVGVPIQGSDRSALTLNLETGDATHAERRRYASLDIKLLGTLATSPHQYICRAELTLARL